MMHPASDRLFTIVVEHLDPELEDWQALEYKCIAEECHTANAAFLLSGLQSANETARQLSISNFNLTEHSVETLYPSIDEKQRVCLLDPKAELDLCPEDGARFDVFLFGGILGDDPPRGIWFRVFGHSTDQLTDAHTEDRTGELRKLGFPARRLGTEQMTTDTAARVTRLIVQDKNRPQIPALDTGKRLLTSTKDRLQDIPYVDRPDIELPSNSNGTEGANPSESVSMPFRYVKDSDGGPVLPKGMLDLLANDADKGILDLL